MKLTILVTTINSNKKRYYLQIKIRAKCIKGLYIWQIRGRNMVEYTIQINIIVLVLARWLLTRFSLDSV